MSAPNRPSHDGQRLDQDVFDSLCAAAALRSYPPQTVLTRQGDLESTFYVVQSGRVAVTRRGENGDDYLLNTLGPLEFFGEMGLLDERPRLATVTTLEDTVVLEITAEQFNALLESNLPLALNVTRRVLASLRQVDNRAIQELRAKNELLQQAYRELQAAQAELLEKERLERELELAAEMQRSLLPAALPSYGGFRFAAYLAPARHVGGDFYDVITLDDEHIGILVADVADKGMHAALIMAVTRTLFFQEAGRSLSPAVVAQCVHRGLLDLGGAGPGGRDPFVTAFYGVIDCPSRTMTYVRAAHDRPLLRRSGESPSSLPGDGRFLGMLEDLELSEYHLTLRPGDRLLLFSDGVPDAMSRAGEPFGLERLESVFEAAGDGSPEGIIEAIRSEIAVWTQGASPTDDITLLVVEVAAS